MLMPFLEGKKEKPDEYGTFLRVDEYCIGSIVRPAEVSPSSGTRTLHVFASCRFVCELWLVVCGRATGRTLDYQLAFHPSVRVRPSVKVLYRY